MAKKEYVSCHYIEHALIFHPRNIYHCCIPVNGKFGSTMICEYHGGPLPVEKIIESREKYRKWHSDMENHPEVHCHGCVHAVRQLWDDHYLFNNLHFNHSLLCNLRCTFCVQRGIDIKQQASDYEVLPVVKSMLEMDSLDPDAFIFWAGGEPMLLSDFEEAFDMAVSHGTRNEVATNSTIFSNILCNHLTNPRVSMKTSVDCGTPETFLRMKRKDWFERVWNNLEHYAATGGLVSAKYILSYENINDPDLVGFIERVKRHGIRWVHLDINHNFRPEEVTEKYVRAAVFLIQNLRQESVNVECGIHSTASIPDFVPRVNALIAGTSDYGSHFTVIEDQSATDPIAIANVKASLVSDSWNDFQSKMPKIELYRGLRGLIRMCKHIRQLRSSGLFDESYYLNEYSDVKKAGVNPLVHYIRHGWREGRRPSEGFDTRYYLMENTDVAACGTNPIIHYIEHGKTEGRNPFPVSQSSVSVSCNQTMDAVSPSHKADHPNKPVQDALAVISQFTARNEDYFADVAPPSLTLEHLAHSRLFPSREQLLNMVPKEGVYAEVGTQTGYFAKQIWEKLNPRHLHIFDLDFTPFDHDYFSAFIRQGSVHLHQGDSSKKLSEFPDAYFDMIYVDGDHMYEGVKKDLEQARRKIKLDGYILCNDYTVYSPMEAVKYGIPRAVNELCLDHNYEIVALALHRWGYHDVALRSKRNLSQTILQM
jgi:pyruvate-formate lyase-activating enzyme